MPLTWKMLKEAQFDWEQYANCDRLGEWEAVVDATAYARGSRMGAAGKGKRAGLHLYVRTIEDDRKFWLFVLFFPASEVYERTKNLSAGERIRVETIQGQHNHTVVRSLNRLE